MSPGPPPRDDPSPDADRETALPGAGAPLFARGTAVSVEGRALLIVGPSGAGKSALALDLVSRGARLVADDGVRVWPGREGLRVGAIEATRGLVEARGMGLLRAPHAPEARLCAIVDLAQEEAARLPPERATMLHGVSLRLFHRARSPSFAAALHLYLLCNAD